MSHRRLAIAVILVGLVFLPAFAAYAQTQWTAPRTLTDQPDLQGIWSHNTRNGATSNALVNDSLTDLGGGATFNDCRVEVVGLVNP